MVVATGGPASGSLCDTAARWETNGSGTAVQPTWVDYTGGDTLLSVAVTGAAVYVGGHERWLNNRHGSRLGQAGAVPRPGLAALDPANGMPFSWNPGRNPRGAGAYAVYATPDRPLGRQRHRLHRQLHATSAARWRSSRSPAAARSRPTSPAGCPAA